VTYSFINILFISTGIFDDELRQQILSVDTTANAALSEYKTESFARRNTSNHAFKIFCSKINCEPMYHGFFILEITVVKIMNNLNVCSAHSYLYTRSRFNTSYVCFIFILCDFFLSLIDISLRIPLC
jgi:hypothetical protein